MCVCVRGVLPQQRLSEASDRRRVGSASCAERGALLKGWGEGSGLSGVDLRAALIQNKLLSEDELAADDERLQQRSTKSSRRRREM